MPMQRLHTKRWRRKYTIIFNQYKQENDIQITQTRDQFRCGMPGYTSEAHPYEMEIKPITKQCGRTYSKGLITRYGLIKPLTIS